MEAARKLPLHWHMTDMEIATSYRQAKNKEMQVRVIADLNVRTCREVCDKLEMLGFDMRRYRALRLSAKESAWNEDEVMLMMRLRDVYDYSFAEIAKALDKTQSAVRNKYRRMNGDYE